MSEPNPGTPFDLIIRAAEAVLPDEVGPAEVGIRDGRIAEIATGGDQLSGAASASAEVIDIDAGQVLLPGLVDSHVHVNDPGRAEWEGFASATRAAAAGGVTTIVDMPLNSLPPTVNVAALETKREVAAPKAFVDVGFWGGAIPGNTADLKPLHDEGVYGFKCFLEDSGVEEFPPLEPDEMKMDMAEIASFDGMLIVHAEDHEVMTQAPKNSGPKFADFLATPPARGRKRRDRPGHRRGQGHRCQGAHSAPVLGRCAGPDRRGQGRRHQTHRRDLPALPRLHRRRDTRRRDDAQVLPADPRGVEPGGAVAGTHRRHHRLHRLRPLTVDG
jgi:hypothetical protein